MPICAQVLVLCVYNRVPVEAQGDQLASYRGIAWGCRRDHMSIPLLATAVARESISVAFLNLH